MCLSLLTSFAGLCIFFTYKDCDPFLEGKLINIEYYEYLESNQLNL